MIRSMELFRDLTLSGLKRIREEEKAERQIHRLGLTTEDRAHK